MTSTAVAAGHPHPGRCRVCHRPLIADVGTDGVVFYACPHGHEQIERRAYPRPSDYEPPTQDDPLLATLDDAPGTAPEPSPLSSGFEFGGGGGFDGGGASGDV